MKKRKRITFEMDEEANISDLIIVVQDNSYIRYIRKIANSNRFAIPKPIIRELNLQKGEEVYFIKTPTGFYLSFRELPDALPRNYRSRKLISAGATDSLYVAIPQFVTHILRKEINYVHLVRPETWRKHEWQIQFLFSECI